MSLRQRLGAAAAAALFLGCVPPGAPPKIPAAGGVAVLQCPHSPKIAVAVAADAAAEAEWQTALLNGDDAAVARMTAAGRLIAAPPQTRVRVLQTAAGPNGPPLVRVRFLAGPETGKEGWTPAEWVRRP